MDPLLELQAAVIARLRSWPAVQSVVGNKVADIAPASWSMPFISLGPSTFTPDNAECVTGGEAMLQIDGWSDATVLSEMRILAEAIRSALVDWEPALTTNALVTFEHWRTDYISAEPLKHASVRFTAFIEQP